MMHTFDHIFSKFNAAVTSRSVKVALMVLTIAVFVLAAGAPNATIGIGK